MLWHAFLEALCGFRYGDQPDEIFVRSAFLIFVVLKRVGSHAAGRCCSYSGSSPLCHHRCRWCHQQIVVAVSASSSPAGRCRSCHIVDRCPHVITIIIVIVTLSSESLSLMMYSGSSPLCHHRHRHHQHRHNNHLHQRVATARVLLLVS